jgi:hypothetical protein
MKTKTYFAFRVDVWDSAANSIERFFLFFFLQHIKQNPD